MALKFNLLLKTLPNRLQGDLTHAETSRCRSSHALRIPVFSVEARAAAIDDVKLETSTEICDGSNAADKSFVVYATNTNSNQRISANFAYETSPAGQAFASFDSNVSPFTEQFPKYHERRLAPGEKAKVGCTFIYRASSQPMVPKAIPLVINKAGAAYIDPSKPEPPPEVGTDYAAFFPQGGFTACTGGPRPAGLFFIENLHPFRTLTVEVDMVPLRGQTSGKFTITLAPLSASRIACSNGVGSPSKVSKADLSGN